MKINPRVTGGLAWAGLALVVGVPVADAVWPALNPGQALTASIAAEKGAAPARPNGPATVATGTGQTRPATPAAATKVAKVDDKPAVSNTEASTDPVDRFVASVTGPAPGDTDTPPPAASPATADAADGAADTRSVQGGVTVETTANSLTITPGRNKPGPAAASQPAQAITDVAAAGPQDAGAALPTGPGAETNGPSAAANPDVSAEQTASVRSQTPPRDAASTVIAQPSSVSIASSEVQPEASSVSVTETANAAAGPAPAGAELVAPIPMPASMRPPPPPKTVLASAASRGTGPTGIANSPSFVVVEPPLQQADVRPLPDSPGAPIVTEQDLKNWKSGTLEQYLAANGYLDNNRSQVRVREVPRRARPNGWVDTPPSDGHYYDEGDAGYPAGF